MLQSRLPDMQRSADCYQSLLKKFSRNYSTYKQQGLESIIFLVDGKLLKIYQWFVIAGLTIDDEYNLLNSNKNLLSIYAPDINVDIVSISSDGIINPSLNQAFAFGLMMSIGDAFLDSVWKSANRVDQCNWAEKIGSSLAQRHQKAPTRSIIKSDNASELTDWISESLTLIYSSAPDSKILPDAKDDIINAVQLAFDTGLMKQSFGNLPVIHGDPNLANILIGKNGDLQFIDPGPALLIGAGVDKPLLRALDVCWDVVLMAKHFRENGGNDTRSAFLGGYAAQNETVLDELLGRMLYWEIFCNLLVVTVCCNKFLDFQLASNPFGAFLISRNLSLDRYIKWYFYQVLYQLGITNRFPAFCEQNSADIF